MKKLVQRVGGNDRKKDSVPNLQGPGYKPLSLVIFNKYDTDGDGSLTLEEFEAFTRDKGYYFTDFELVTGFSKIDKDGSGDITYDEFKEFWKEEDRLANMKLTPQQSTIVSQVFDFFFKFDGDRNGVLDFNEFEGLFKMMQDFKIIKRGTAKDVFNDIDVNGDKTIEFPELLLYFIEKFGILDTEDSQN
uniref:EF-hand domain-containing protein n=1 Tax=Aplanochytrium stocchinoi TaxID=215587 RepID=A0A7S3V2E5_9STRA|mmetsp:Transcript_7928/g.8973  ORF Transcript_7928/g.8973 Transcript_7928/m.8973 type:complete len:189 (+) Transcript_7928:139-705(+)